MSESTSPIKYFLSGGFGGICTVIAGHPLDTIKVSSNVISHSDAFSVVIQPLRYSTSLNCLRCALCLYKTKRKKSPNRNRN